MTPELEEYFDNFNVLFGQKGYEQLMDEIQSKINNLSNITNIQSADELFFRKGQIEALRGILALQDTITIAREQAEEPEDVQDF